MTRNKSVSESYVQYQGPRNIYLGDSTVILEIVLDLHQVLFIPKLTKNLLSVPAMALIGAEIQFHKDQCLVRKNGQEFYIESLLRDKLNIVNPTKFPQVSRENSASSLAVWHCRLGHLNYAYINQLVKKEMIDGMNCDSDTQLQKECEACVHGKMQKKPFSKQSQHRATRPYEIVHSDVCGPMQVESKGGSRYMVTFTDDLS